MTNALNTALLRWMAAGDDPNSWALLTGSIFALWGSVLCAAAVIWAGWHARTERPYLSAVVAGAAVASLLSHLIAAWLNVPRPFVAGLVPAYIVHGPSASLPSTHATVMFFVGFAFMLRTALRRIGVVALVLAALTGWARIYVGVHSPIDIVAGIALAGVLVGALALLHAGLTSRTAARRAFRKLRPPLLASDADWRVS
ncbi:MAG: putative phosphoesterase, superfamily [Variovorax sp.]|jgi:membrane-associated phospholipid phosphatase|nr:putative phosphoesterase, superfamily [Variovorax sp.]